MAEPSPVAVPAPEPMSIEHPGVDLEPSGLDLEPGGSDLEPGGFALEHAALEIEQANGDLERAAGDLLRAPFELEPAAEPRALHVPASEAGAALPSESFPSLEYPGVVLLPDDRPLEPLTAAQARLGFEGLSRLRARHAEVLARISEKVTDAARRDELKSRCRTS